MNESMIAKQLLDTKIEDLVLEFAEKYRVKYEASVKTVLVKQEGVISNCYSEVESVLKF